ncbi:CDP-glycerol glycerophosphotransferase family protein [Pseudoalteromonas sp. NGC95]|uniref:CDP-glycerol glycerophosphotransferase family protein n=1 Tax=Pseudoalteromonas sp. NGC95 TaxID=2792051 RepID=UPI0018CEC065|nr:CDP-glycerol glycerophosphotransferase family protein [Pseudoalteromonas sp. NGC95]MBH0015103.1 CDP-glycerol glycerophosphotransferase family protein [Pseudoalteromonas sp. NGC95]
MLGPIYIFSFLIPKCDKVWCFGGFGDKYSDSSQILFEFASKKNNFICVWITGSKDLRRKLISDGYKCELRYSIKGILYQLISKKYIYSCYISDINFWTSGGAIKINLWHGIPLKKIEHDIVKGPLSKVFNPTSKFSYLCSHLIYPATNVISDVVFYSSEYERKIYETAFKPKKMIKAFSPRNISILDKYKTESSTKAYKVLFAPTWRSCGVELNYEFNDAIITEVYNFCKIKKLKLDISIHPASNYMVKDNIQYTSVSGGNLKLDEYELLITDFSSICFDFFLVGKSVLFTANDLDLYNNSDRGFYRDAYEFLEKNIITELEALRVNLDTYSSGERYSESFVAFDKDAISNVEAFFGAIECL